MNKTYLGDGVYAELDPSIDQIWLTTEREGGALHRIALGPHELKALNDYANRSWSADPPAPVEYDIEYVSHGSVGILTGLTAAGEAWLAGHLQAGVQRWGTNGYVVEPRYVQDILHGADGDGLRIKP